MNTDNTVVKTLQEGEIAVTHVKTFRGKTHLAFVGITVEELRTLCRSIGLSLARPVRDTERWIKSHSLHAEKLNLTKDCSIVVIASQLEGALLKLLPVWVSEMRARTATQTETAIAAVS